MLLNNYFIHISACVTYHFGKIAARMKSTHSETLISVFRKIIRKGFNLRNWCISFYFFDSNDNMILAVLIMCLSTLYARYHG